MEAASAAEAAAAEPPPKLVRETDLERGPPAGLLRPLAPAAAAAAKLPVLGERSISLNAPLTLGEGVGGRALGRSCGGFGCGAGGVVCGCSGAEMGDDMSSCCGC